jgi:hypothetical protein
MRITRVSPTSVAKVAFILYAGIGLIIGAIVACASLFGAAFAPHGSDGAGMFGAIFGVGAVIVFPIMYGVFGALGALIGSAIYNVVASIVGGVEITVEPLAQSH